MRRPVSAIALLVLAGCSVGPDFHRPAVTSDAHWKPLPGANGAPTFTEATPDVEWWASFGDPELTQLEQRVASSNPDVLIATARLAQSRAFAKLAGAERYPTLSAAGSYTREQFSTKSLESIAGKVAGSVDTPVARTISANAGRLVIPPLNGWQDGLDASWEVDLWGRVRRQYEAARADEAANEADRNGVLIARLAETARDYFRLRGAQEKLSLLDQEAAAAKTLAMLQAQRSGGGLETAIPASDAASDEAAIDAERPRAEEEIWTQINALSLLLGEAPRALADELLPGAKLPAAPPTVPAGLPSQLAERRPDILAADARLHAATARVAEADAEFYPRVTIDAGFGFESFSFRDLGFWNARAWNVGPSITLPIFQGGRLRGQLALREGEQQEAALAYRKTVLRAWQEVDDAMITSRKQNDRTLSLSRSLQATNDSYALMQVRLRHGEITELPALHVKLALLDRRQSLLDSRLVLNDALVTLYVALGGGWK